MNKHLPRQSSPWKLFVWPAFREAAHNVRYGFASAWFILRGGMRPGSSRKERK